MTSWPSTAEELVDVQHALAEAAPVPWHPPAGHLLAAGCFVCFPKGVVGHGSAADPAWAAAAELRGRRRVGTATVTGTAHGPYEPGLLALREGALLEAAVRRLPDPPDLLIVNATGRDHPRGAGLALHLGAVLDLPTIGVTHRPLLAHGAWPTDEYGATSPLELGGQVVGCWLRSRAGRRPLAVHAAWRTDSEEVAEIVLRTRCQRRTPAPLREARRLARTARAASRPPEAAD